MYLSCGVGLSGLADGVSTGIRLGRVLLFLLVLDLILWFLFAWFLILVSRLDLVFISLVAVFLSLVFTSALFKWIILPVAEGFSAWLLWRCLPRLGWSPYRVRLLAGVSQSSLIVLLLYVAVGHSGLLYYGSLASTTLIAASAVPIAVLAVESRVVSEGARATVRPLGSSEEWVMGVLGELRHVCSGLGGAEVLVEETGNINASIDQSAKPVRVVITRGALEKLTEEELKAMLAHECGHLDTGLFHRVTGIASLPFLLAVVTTLVLPVVIGVLSTNTVLALLEPVETPRLFTSTLTAVLALFTTFISVIYQRMLGELVADVKSVEITGGNVLETVLSKIEQVNKPADIKGLLRKHLDYVEFLFSPIVRALLLINDVHPPTQLRIRLIKEHHQRIFETRSLTT